MAFVLLRVLERTELNQLPKNLQNKLESFLNELHDVNESLKRHNERLNVEHGVWVILRRLKFAV